MASRQSLRLLEMGPELQPFKDKCFICQLDLDIQSLKRCQVMPCCRKFLQKRCFKKARETSFQCGHCRTVGKDQNSNSTESVENELRADERLEDWDEIPVWVIPLELRGPTLIERARNAIADLRGSALAHSHHQPGTRSWLTLPYVIDSMVWYLFWVNMDWLISTIPEGPRPLFINAVVYTPIEPTQLIRKTVYTLIDLTMPVSVRECLSFVRYRIRFRLIDDRIDPYDRNEVTFTHIRFSRYWSPAYHPKDCPYTTELPPTPPESSESSPER